MDPARNSPPLVSQWKGEVGGGGGSAGACGGRPWKKHARGFVYVKWRADPERRTVGSRPL